MWCRLQEVTRSWFSSLFCTALPAETAVRIWDVLFLEGPKILFRVALALFKVWLYPICCVFRISHNSVIFMSACVSGT